MAGAIGNIFEVLENDKASGTDTLLPVDTTPVQRAEPDLIDGLLAQDQAREDKAPKFPGAMPFGLKQLEPIAPDVLAENVSLAFKRTGGLAPDQVAEVRSLAKQTSLPEPFVQANLAQVRDIAKYPDPDVPELTRTNPGTALFLSDPANMALAKDDVAGLQRLENSLGDLWPGVQAAQAARDTSPWSAWDRFWQKNKPVDERTGLAWLASAPGQAWDAGREQNALAYAYSQMLLEGDRPELRRTIDQMKLAQVQVPKAESYLEKILTGGMVQTAQYRDMLPDIGWPALAGGALMYGTTMAATKNPAAAAVAAERGLKVGAGAGAYYSMFKLEGGSALEEYMAFTDANTGMPVDFNVARGMATLTGAANAGLEAAELAVLLEMTGVSKAVSGLTEATKRQFVKEAVVKGMGLPSTRALMARIGAKGVGAWLLESGQEGLQELVTIFFGEMAKDMHNAQAPGNFIEPMSAEAKGQRVGQTVVDASASFLPLVGGGAGIGMYRSAKALAKARVVEAKLADFKATLDANRLSQRSPEAVEQAVRTMTGTPEGQAAPQLYISAQAFEGYFQQADAMDEAMRMLEVMGISQDEYAHAKAVNGDLALPTDKVASTLAQGKHWDGLAQDLKVDAFDISARQALGIDQEAEQVRIQELAQAFDAAQVPGHEVDRLAGELMASGRVSKNQAIMTARLFGNLARTLTQSGHETPASWFERNKIRIQADSLEAFKRRYGESVTAADLSTAADQGPDAQSEGQGDIQQGNRVAVPIVEIMQNVRTRLEGYQSKLADELAKNDEANQDSIAALSAAIDRDQTRLERLTNQVDDGQTHIAGPLFQTPMNEDVDLNRTVAVLDAGEVPIKTAHLGQLRKNALAQAKLHVGQYVNADTGWTVSITGQAARHVAEDHNSEAHYPAMVQAMAVLPQIVESAVLVETHADLKNQAGVAQVHRLYAPVRVGDGVYVVKLTVKEKTPGEVNLDEFRLYDLKSEKKMPTGTYRPLSGQGPNSSRPAVGISKMTIWSMLDGVKDNDGRLFFHDVAAVPRGVIYWEQGQTIVSLFEKANVSTVPHELGHLYLTELERLASLGHATAQQEVDLATIRSWLREKDERISEKGQEQFANGFLTYLREGKAPTEALFEVFAKFKRWLLTLYKAARGAGVKINPDIRAVYDRMLATQEDLDGARHKYGLEPIFAGETSLDESVLTAQELEAYETLANRASLAADIEMQKYHEAERRKYRQQLVEHFDDELKNNKAYRLVTYLAYNYDPLMENKPDRKAKDYTPGPRLNLESARYLWGQEVNERVRPGLLSKDSTYTVEQAMIEFEFDSPEAVLEALSFKGGEQRRAFVDSGLAQFDADWNEYGTPWANELQEKRLDAEARMLQRLARNFVPATMEGIKRMVARKVDNMTVSQLQASFQNLKAAVAKVGAEIKQDKFLLAVALKNEANLAVKEQREVNKARVAALRENWAKKVAEANERRRLALAEIRERTQAREEMAKLKVLSKNIHKSRKMDFDYREQAMAIVQRFGLGTPTMAPAMPYDMPTLIDFVKEKGIDVAALAMIPAWLFSEPQSGYRSVQTMTVTQMRELKSALAYLHHQGMNEKKMLGLAEDILITDVAERSVVTLNQLTKGPKAYSERERDSRKGRLGARWFLAQVGMVRYWADAADGFTNHGPNSVAGNTTAYLVHPFDQAESDKQHALRQMGDKLDKIFEPYLAQDLGEVFNIEGVPLLPAVAQEWGGLWDRQKVLMVALNMGNEGNIRALMGGYGWSYEHLAKITERLTADEWRMVQQIWDTIDELYPLIDHVHRVVNGGPLLKVDALPLDSPAGHLRGGYFPLIFDHRLSDKAAFLGGLDKLLNEVETGAYADEIQHTAAVFRKSNPVNSFTKERKGSSLPPLLSLGVLSSHINSSLHFIHFGMPVRNAYKLVNVPEFRTAWVKAMGEDSYMELGNWLRRQARPSLVMPGKFDKMFEKLRKLYSIQALGLSMQTALTQISSAPMSWQEIGFKAFMRGAAIMAEHGAEAFAVAADLSPYMADRRHNLDSTMHDLVMKLELDKHQIKLLQKVGVNLTVKDYQDFMFSLIQTMDALVAYPTWYGAYDQALNQRGMDPNQAVAYADEKVKRAQASGGIVDAPTFLRTAGLPRLFSMFMSFSTNLLNNQAYFIRGWREGMISSRDFMRHIMLSWVLPPVLTSCIIAWAKGEPWPEFRDLFFDLFGYLLSGIPGLRDIAGMLEFGGRARGSASTVVLELVSKATLRTMNLLDDKNRDGEFLLAAQSLVDLIGFSVGIPTRPIWRAVQGAHDMAEGKTVNPMRLFFRAPKEGK